MTTTTTTFVALPTGNVDTVLDRAADYLARHGWTPTGPYDAHDRCTARCACHRTGTYPASMIGAIRCVVFGQPRWYLDLTDPAALHEYTAAVEWLNTYLIAHGHNGKRAPIFDWETTAGRARIHVIAALQYAATAYRHHTPRSTP